MAKFDNIKKQAQFCAELMVRLNDDIQEETEESPFWGMKNKSQKQMDVIRLRRELIKLNLMLN